MTHDSPAYGLWLLVAANSIIFIMFAFSFSKPQSPRDWRLFGMFSALIVALFAEMYGFPLTTILTLLMLPALAFMYCHLAHTEEAEAGRKFGDASARYAARVPGWFPHLGTSGTQSGTV